MLCRAQCTVHTAKTLTFWNLQNKLLVLNIADFIHLQFHTKINVHNNNNNNSLKSLFFSVLLTNFNMSFVMPSRSGHVDTLGTKLPTTVLYCNKRDLLTFSTDLQQNESIRKKPELAYLHNTDKQKVQQSSKTVLDITDLNNAFLHHDMSYFCRQKNRHSPWEHDFMQGTKTLQLC